CMSAPRRLVQCRSSPLARRIRIESKIAHQANSAQMPGGSGVGDEALILRRQISHEIPLLLEHSPRRFSVATGAGGQESFAIIQVIGSAMLEKQLGRLGVTQSPRELIGGETFAVA